MENSMSFYLKTFVLLAILCYSASAGKCGYTCSPDDETLDCWRENIDYYSDIILEALNQRAIVANHIGEWKRKRNLPIVDLTRVGAVLDRIAKRNPGPLPDSAIIEVFGSIVNETAAYEEKFKGEPDNYNCHMSSVQFSTGASAAGAQNSPIQAQRLNQLLIGVLIVQVVVIIAIFVSTFCVLKKMNSIRR